MTWKEVYQLPLLWKKSTAINVLSKNYVTALTFTFDYFNPSKQQIIEKIVAKLNGDTTIKFDGEFTLHNNTRVFYNGELMFMIRGWGYLTGIGALNLPEDEAIKIQDDFANFVIETLNS